jgi:hypothetical protein
MSTRLRLSFNRVRVLEAIALIVFASPDRANDRISNIATLIVQSASVFVSMALSNAGTPSEIRRNSLRPYPKCSSATDFTQAR